MASQSIIPDDQMTASSFSSLGSNKSPYYGRLHGIKAWCSETRNSINDWLQVDLGKEFALCGIATQGNILFSYVTNFKLSFSSDGNTWTIYKYDNGTEVVRFNFIYHNIVIIILKRKNLVSIYFLHTFTYATTKLVSSTDLVSCMRCVV